MADTSSGSGSAARRVAAQILVEARRGRSLTEVLPAGLPAELSDQDRAFVRRLVRHVVRHRRRLDAQLRHFVPRAPKPLVRELLLIGLAQIEMDDVPDHAAVHATVAAAPKPQRGLCNAVLRRRLREGAPSPAGGAETESFPDWLFERIDADWGERAPALRAALNRDLPMVLRVDTRRRSRDELAAGLSVEHGLHGEVAIALARPLPLDSVPGFAEGEVSVQGLSAQQAAPLLAVEPGQRVLDACAAPGGKTAHLLQLQPDLDLLAVDVDRARLERIRIGFERLGLAPRLECADAAALAGSQAPASFDRILVDAPCSGTGVIGKHPDIKWLRRASDIETLTVTQLQLLTALWPLLKPGGCLLYATCSILTAENEDVVSRFITETADARADAITLPAGEPTAHGWRIAPDGLHEGFYYARLRRAVHERDTTR